MRSLAFRETVLGLRRGSLPIRGETSPGACSPGARVSRRIETFFCTKGRRQFGNLRDQKQNRRGVGAGGMRADVAVGVTRRGDNFRAAGNPSNSIIGPNV